MQNIIRNIEPGRPAREGQLILERRYRIALKALGSEHSWGKLLDIGCGNGAQTAYFKDIATKITGTDLFPLSSTEGPQTGAWWNFVQGSILELPFKSDSFDTITSFEVLEHVPDDRQAVTEIARVLKPDGIFLFSVPNRWWILESHGAIVPGLHNIPWNRVPFISWLPTKIHDRIAKARIYTIAKAKRLVEGAGLIPVTSGYITAPLDVMPDTALRGFLRTIIFRGDTTVIPFLAVNLFVVGKKVKS